MKVTITVDTLEDGHITIDEMLKGGALASAIRDIDNDLKWIEDSTMPTLTARRARDIIREYLGDLNALVFP
jgi:hypothetical protein